MINFAIYLFNIKMTISNNNINNIKTITINAIRKAKKEIPMYTGMPIAGKQFETGKILLG